MRNEWNRPHNMAQKMAIKRAQNGAKHALIAPKNQHKHKQINGLRQKMHDPLPPGSISGSIHPNQPSS
jgi:hypothetical protein